MWQLKTICVWVWDKTLPPKISSYTVPLDFEEATAYIYLFDKLVFEYSARAISAYGFCRYRNNNRIKVGSALLLAIAVHIIFNVSIKILGF